MTESNEHTSSTSFTGTFHWIPAADNGPSMPLSRTRMTAFAYVEPRFHLEGAVMIEGMPPSDTDGPVEVRWLPGYPVPETRTGDTVTITASQRGIATITVTAVNNETRRP